MIMDFYLDYTVMPELKLVKEDLEVMDFKKLMLQLMQNGRSTILNTITAIIKDCLLSLGIQL